MQYLSRPVQMSLSWLFRGSGATDAAVACFLPECATLVGRQVGAGRPSWFCCQAHRHQFRRRRASLGAALGEIDDALAEEVREVPKARLVADRRYLESALLAYPDLATHRG